MKSIYQDKNFSDFWDKRAGENGEPYKEFVIDPVMFSLIGNLYNKDLVEVGCGNGYLANTFLKKGVKSLVLLDISSNNLDRAKEKVSDKTKVKFLEADIEKKIDIESHTADIVYSNMVMNEIENIQVPFSEIFRILRDGGEFVFSVTHPTWDIIEFLNQSNKIRQLGNYFRRGFAKYVMRTKDGSGVEYEVEHYQRPLSDYFNKLVEAGFVVNRIEEPEISRELLDHHPRFSEYKDHPIGLIFHAIKKQKRKKFWKIF